jgi:hypothetical protein
MRINKTLAFLTFGVIFGFFAQTTSAYYSPEVGRFISRDPIEYEAEDINLYRYVYNSPIQYTDIDGSKISFCCRTCANAAGGYTWGGVEYLENQIDHRDDFKGGNAMKHCLASCRTTKSCGSSCAKEFWDGWEQGGIESQQDIKNNAVGRRLGESQGSCWQNCYNAWASGEFTCQDKTRSKLVKCPPPGGIPRHINTGLPPKTDKQPTGYPPTGYF